MGLARRTALPAALLLTVGLMATGAAAAHGAQLEVAQARAGADARTLPNPRTAVGRIAALIRADFYDAARAARIANGLEAAAEAGAFDRFADPRDLAFELTRRLAPEDRHFAVSWAPLRAGEAGPALPTPPDLSRANHGFAEARVLPGGVGYLKLDQFAHVDGPGGAAQAAADAALAFVAAAPSLIIDLRDNGGGSPTMVGYLVQQFVADPQKVANRFHSRRGPDRLELSPVAATRPPRLETPLFILVSGRTGSAAEALAYTLQAAGRATVIGEPTGGAANPGGIRHTADGFRIFVSVGTPVNPFTGRNWEAVGVTPDIAVPQAAALRTAHVRALEAEGQALPTASVRVLETLRHLDQPPAALAHAAGHYGDLEIVAEGATARLRQGRRPERTLVPLGADRFSLAEDPAARLRLERAPQTGTVTALVREMSGGGEVRYYRTPPDTADLQ